MSFDRLPSLESQPTNFRREDDPQYRDDPEFDELTSGLSDKLFTLTSNIARLSNQIALLGTKRDTDRVRERVHDLLEETRDGFKDIGEGVKKVQSWEDVSPSQKYTQQKLTREFQASLSEFQVTQRQAVEKQRASATAARTALDEQGTSPSDEQQGGQQQQQEQEQEQLRLASQDEVDFQESLIVERESEIRNIEQGVGELNELFRDVAHIVHEQGAQVDLIDANVEGVRTDTQGADLELRSASRYQKNARNKACCLLLILAVVLTVVILAVVLG
ncbi:MAG: hypothetical protein M1812_005639 [Candelaria pacifica]|nr:MAG: hypothetical protein M1812_005639 [Candelaria pacifica]